MPKLTPLDIRKQEFPQRFRGYDPDEVDTFLDLIADDAEGLTNERNHLQERVATLETQLAEFREMERSLRDALVMAEKMSTEANENAQRRIDSMLREAEVKAIGIIGEAESKSREILMDAENRRRALLLELEALESQRSYALSKFRSLLDDQRAVLEAHLMSRPGATSLRPPMSANPPPHHGPAPAPPMTSMPAPASSAAPPSDS
jgi:cell division initiation protein